MCAPMSPRNCGNLFYRHKQKGGVVAGLYIHWPFCLAKCPYCDFNSHRSNNLDQPRWRTALRTELRSMAQRFPGSPLTSVFFGGGTPSLMDPATVAALLDDAEQLWGFSDDVEITLEANPTSSELKKFKDFKEAGINRLSLGMQALQDEALQRLGRQHSVAEARQAYTMATTVFPRVSADFIYARAGQTLQMWDDELTEILNMGGQHISLYHLTLEDGTPLTRHPPADLPDEDTVAAMFTLTRQRLAAAGLPAYEVSNHAVNGMESRHNLLYWQGGDYIGIGPGAHGRWGGYALEQSRSPYKWLEQVEQKGDGGIRQERLTVMDRALEVAMMGLRLTDGIKKDDFQNVTGIPLDHVLSTAGLQQCCEDGLVRNDPERLFLTEAGWLMLNSITLAILNFDPQN